MSIHSGAGSSSRITQSLTEKMRYVIKYSKFLLYPSCRWNSSVRHNLILSTKNYPYQYCRAALSRQEWYSAITIYSLAFVSFRWPPSRSFACGLDSIISDWLVPKSSGAWTVTKRNLLKITDSFVIAYLGAHAMCAMRFMQQQQKTLKAINSLRCLVASII